MIRSAAVLAIYACIGANAQSSDRREFDAASIKPTPPWKGGVNMQGCRGGPQTSDPATFSCIAAPLWILVAQAYRIPSYRLAGPGWLKDSLVLFDLNAKIPENATREQFPVMLQNLLKDRFHLVVHHESRQTEQYNLVVGKNGPKFKEAPASGSPGDATSALNKSGCPALPKGAFRGNVNGRTVMHEPADAMSLFVSRLTLELGKPVRDMTGLTGKYDIAMCWAPEGAGPDTSTASGPTLMEALQDQLGLRLETIKAPVDFIVVDSADKSPTPN